MPLLIFSKVVFLFNPPLSFGWDRINECDDSSIAGGRLFLDLVPIAIGAKMSDFF